MTATVRPPDVAVVIPTLGRVHEALRLSEGLSAQVLDASFQVLIVLQTEEDFEAAASAELPRFVRLLRCPTIGAATARNHGARASDARVLVFLDDDCHPLARDWLSHLVEPILAGRHVCATGPVLGWTAARRRWAGTRFANRVIPVLLHPVGFPGNTTALQAASVWGGNFAIARAAFLTIGGFDEVFTSPSLYEETELSMRVRWMLVQPIAYAPEAAVEHVQSPTGGQREFLPAFGPAFLGEQKGKLIGCVYTCTDRPAALATSLLANGLLLGAAHARLRPRAWLAYCQGLRRGYAASRHSASARDRP